jgi:type IV pilus assembly protein PilC
MAESIQSGSTFAEALSQHPRIFNRLFINMVKAGELGGVLDIVLTRLADFMEKAQKIKSKVISAMVYPIVVLCMAVAILAFLMIFIIPKFEEIFDELLEGRALPGLTQFVLGVSRTMSQRVPFILIVVAVLVVLIKLFGKTSGGRYVLDRLKLGMPIFGPLVKKTAIARFTRTLGTLMTSGVPVLQALTIVRDTAGNEVVAKAVNQVHDSVKEGENMAPPLEASGTFPPVVISMVEVGEETGDLPEMLMKVADSFDDEVDNTVAGLTSVIEPVLIIFLAVIVGTIVISLFLPLITIIGQLS